MLGGNIFIWWIKIVVNVFVKLVIKFCGWFIWFGLYEIFMWWFVGMINCIFLLCIVFKNLKCGNIWGVSLDGVIKLIGYVCIFV